MTDAPITPAAPAAPITQQRNEVVDLVTAKVQRFVECGDLHLPENYSAPNALKGAWLVLQETVDRDKRPVLSVCTKASIANALLNMVVQGLNAEKKQCYFIAYADRLVCQRSYFGAMAVASRVDPSIIDLVAQVVYEGDEFRYSVVRGRVNVVEHVQSLENIDRAKVKAAYCSVIRVTPNGEEREDTTLMTFDEIKQAWRQSQTRPVTDSGGLKPDSTHAKFTAEMCKKTVINRACKTIVNTADDADLLIRAWNESDQDVVEAQVVEARHELANTGEVVALPEVACVPPVAEDEGAEPTGAENLSSLPPIEWPGEGGE